MGLAEAALSTVLTHALDELTTWASDHLAAEEGALTANREFVRTQLLAHARRTEQWASEIALRDLAASRRLAGTYVDLDLNVRPIRVRGRGEEDRTFKVSQLFSVQKNFVLIGDPGAGKTTSVKKLILDALREGGPFPLLVRLRELPDRSSLVERLLDVCGLSVDVTKVKKSARFATKLNCLQHFLDAMPAILFIDGLDEVNAGSLDGVVEDLRNLFLGARRYRVVATCRAGAAVYAFENSTRLEISALSDEQVHEFVTKWLGDARVPDLLAQIEANPYAGSEVRPLTLAHLCVIFERQGHVPEKPKSVYRMIVRLLLQEWDQQRSVRRKSSYAGFEVDRKEEFLEALAFRLTAAGARGSFAHEQLEAAYTQICHDFMLPSRQVTEVAREIESHTGLILESGRDYYEFAHKSLQEYLCAQYIVRSPELPKDDELLLSLPNELALAVSISSRPSNYFSSVVRRLLRTKPEDGLAAFVGAFVHRLQLERVDFPASLEAAVTGLALLSFAYQEAREGKGDNFELHEGAWAFAAGSWAASLRTLMEVGHARRGTGNAALVTVDYYSLEQKSVSAASFCERLQFPDVFILPESLVEAAGVELRE